VFINSMSDLFHADVPTEFIARVFAVTALAHRHTFQVLTKRHARLRAVLSDLAFAHQVCQEMPPGVCPPPGGA
jgi:protein gp37